MTLDEFVARFPGWHISLNLSGCHARRGPMQLHADTATELADLIWDYWSSGGKRED